MRLSLKVGLAAGLWAGALAAVPWLMCREDIAAARARLAGRSEAVRIAPYGRVEYASAGSGAPLLMIHGSGGGFDQGLAFAEGLVPRRFRIIAPSRFGYLASDYPEGASPEMQADALAALLKRLGVGRAVIVGGSAGALSAAQLALRHPEMCRGLILLVPASYAPDRRRNESAVEGALARSVMLRATRSDHLFWAGARLAPSLMTRSLLATEPGLVEAGGPAEQRRVLRVLEDVLPVSDRWRGLALDSATAGAPPKYPLERLACPLLAISARDDLYGTAAAARYAAATAPRGKLVLYETGGHLLVGRGRAVADEIDAFVASLPP
jgi:pimeloyl-ACP methyl ester carboxylesterase